MHLVSQIKCVFTKMAKNEGTISTSDLHVAITAFADRLSENRLADTEFDVIKV